jgi:hypothetical protein
LTVADTIPFPAHPVVSSRTEDCNRDEIIARWQMKGDQRLLPIVAKIRSGEIELDEDDFYALDVDGYQIEIQSGGGEEYTNNLDNCLVRVGGLMFEAVLRPTYDVYTTTQIVDVQLRRAVTTAVRACFIADAASFAAASEGDDVESWL